MTQNGGGGHDMPVVHPYGYNRAAAPDAFGDDMGVMLGDASLGERSDKAASCGADAGSGESADRRCDQPPTGDDRAKARYGDNAEPCQQPTGGAESGPDLPAHRHVFPNHVFIEGSFGFLVVGVRHEADVGLVDPRFIEELHGPLGMLVGIEQSGDGLNIGLRGVEF